MREVESYSHGLHRAAWRFLGAHVMSSDGVAGVRFAVWAPDAERVSVVGPFYDWDGRRYPMRVLGSSGVWELFIPGLGAGELYKFEIRSRHTGAVFLKTDPFARAAELRPATASIVTAPSTFDWHDREWIEQRAEARLAACAHEHLRSAPGLLAAPGRRRLPQLPRDRRPARALRAAPRLHARRAAADHRTPAGRFLGLPDHRLLRAHAAATARRTTCAISSTAATRRHRRAARLGARALPARRARPRALRRHGALRIRRPAQGRAQGLGHARLQLRAPRGARLPAFQRVLLAGGVPLRRAARGCGRLHALPRLRQAARRVRAATCTAARRTSRPSTSCAS